MISYKLYEGQFYANKGGLRVADYTLVINLFGVPIKTNFFECIDDWKKDEMFYKYKIIKILNQNK